MSLSKKSFFGAAIGTMIEYYDYALFSMFLPILAPIFFPAESAYQSLVKGYFILLLSMIARPFGAALFGFLGDTLGRRKALLLSLYGIAFATLLIGITPSYADWGIYSTIIVILAKSLQIFCFGGEYNGAGIYVVEHAQHKNEALIGGLLAAMTLVGSLIASVIGVILTMSNMPAWSWRFAFILGGIFGVLGIFYRKNLAESPHFTAADKQQKKLSHLVKLYPKELLAGIFIGGFATAPYTTAITFVAPVLMTKAIITSHQFMLIQTILITLAILTAIGAGWIADKKSPAKIMHYACVLLIFLPYPLLSLIDHSNLYSMVCALAGLIVIDEIFLGPSNAYLKNLFPMQYRYRGSSISFCLGMSLVGGLTPVIENYLYQLTNHFASAAIWLAFIGIGAMYSLRNAKTESVKLVEGYKHA
jgi:MFS transporter, MHS family, proline/betaine transporter